MKYLKTLFSLAFVFLIVGCNTHKYRTFRYDNGDDYICEGLRRIVDKNDRIGFADDNGNVVIRPQFAFAFPFEDGLAKASNEGKSVTEGEYHRWISPNWFYIDHKGKTIPSDSVVSVKGRVEYSPDKTPLAQTIIRRISDGHTILSDKNGNFQLKAQKGDSIRFTYIGTITRTIPISASDTSIIVSLDPYIPGNDEYVSRIRNFNYAELETYLNTYIADKSARIGVAVIIEGKDTVSVNGNDVFPMMSVFKFPIALAVAEWADSNNISFNDTVSIDPKELKEDTYSPMLKKYGNKLNELSIRELLEWSLIESDNNAADILLKLTGGTSYATETIKRLSGIQDISIGATEDDMHNNRSACLLNRSTPLAMASLFEVFDTDLKKKSQSFYEISLMLERCRTGLDRIAAPLDGTNSVIGHKTGTGFDTPDGGISAVNDCGYVHLPDGTRYSIAIFIADSKYGIEETSGMAARISEIVLNSLKHTG